MIRVLLFFIGVAALALGAVWLADRPGDIAITWLGYRIETSVMVGAAALALLIAATILVWSILNGIVRAPKTFSAFRSNRRTNRGYRAISRGIIAIGAGDAPAARRFAQEARRLMPNEPLALLLGAQTAQLAGDGTEAERTFRTMAKRNDTKLLGLHGLFVEAQRRDDPAAARAHAEEAVKTEPTLAWAAEAVLQYRCADGDWNGALAALDSNMYNGLLTKDVYKRQRAVLLTGACFVRRNRPRDGEGACAARAETVPRARAGRGARRAASGRSGKGPQSEPRDRARMGRQSASRSRRGLFRDPPAPIEPRPARPHPQPCSPYSQSSGDRAGGRPRRARRAGVRPGPRKPCSAARQSHAARRGAHGGAGRKRKRRYRALARMDVTRTQRRSAIRPGPPTASCRTPGCRSRRQADGSTRSSGASRSPISVRTDPSSNTIARERRCRRRRR